MTVKTSKGKLFTLVGSWDSNMVFAPEDDGEVMMYTREEFEGLLKSGKLVRTCERRESGIQASLKGALIN